MFVFARRVRHVARAKIINESYTGEGMHSQKKGEFFFSSPFEKASEVEFLFSRAAT